MCQVLGIDEISGFLRVFKKMRYLWRAILVCISLQEEMGRDAISYTLLDFLKSPGFSRCFFRRL